jgi:hypothetical protein
MINEADDTMPGTRFEATTIRPAVNCNSCPIQVNSRNLTLQLIRLKLISYLIGGADNFVPMFWQEWENSRYSAPSSNEVLLNNI